MKNRWILLLPIFLLLGTSWLQGQQFFVPRNIGKAYNKGTRSLDGKPGPNYWQNHADYIINATVVPETKTIKGTEDVTYYNESPDTIKFFVIRLYQNMNKIGAARNTAIDRAAVTDGMTIHSLSVNGKTIDVENPDQATVDGTLLYFPLGKDKIAPKGSLKLSVSWEFELPPTSWIRMGAYDSTSYFAAYWYPQIAVYDDLDGWDMDPYNAENEFYNDFNNYAVSITAPKSFMVWATGVWINPEEVLVEEHLKRYKAAETSEEVIHIVTAEELKAGKYYRGEHPSYTFRYRAENVSDFVFGTSDHYQWDAVSTMRNPERKERVLIQTAYNPTAPDFPEVAWITQKSIDAFVNEFPKVVFPFPRLTVFQGDYGMEYPMMVNDGSFAERSETVFATSHEVCHTYFPFLVGVNETEYAWMDEGWATMLPFDMQPKMDANLDARIWNAAALNRLGGTETDVPLSVTTNYIRGTALQLAQYAKPAMAYYYLRNALGDELFLKCLHEYIARWSWKHPMPFDFFNTFNDVSGEDLGWFWKPWFIEPGYADLALTFVEQKEGTVYVQVDKQGSQPVPIVLTITNDAGKVITVESSTAVWKDGKKQALLTPQVEGTVTNIVLGAPHIVDVDPNDNVWKK